MEIFDVSLVLSDDLVVYEGDPAVKISQVSSIMSSGVKLSEIRMGLHSGTHVDAPAHYFEAGKCIDELLPVIGKAEVCDLSSTRGAIVKEDLVGCKIKEGDIVLFKTSNSELLKKDVFSREYVSLGLEAAKYLVGKKVAAVGIDYLSIESFDSEDKPVHKLLLGENIPVIEGLDLADVEPGEYTIFCLPLKVKGGEAAPARCVLVR